MKRLVSVLIFVVAAAVGCATVPPNAPHQPHPAPPVQTHGTLAFEVVDDADQPICLTLSLHTGEQAETNASGYVKWDGLLIGPRHVVAHYSCDAVAGHDAREFGPFEFDALFEQREFQQRVVISRIKRAPPRVDSSLPWRGQLRVARDDLGFQDGEGQWQLPQCLHYMEAFSAFVHDKSVDGVSVEQQLRTAKGAGHQCIRFLDILGYYDQNRPDQPVQWRAWRDREVTPYRFVAYSGRVIEATAGYYERLEQFLRLVKSIGLTVQHDRGDMNALSFVQIREHLAAIVPIYDRVGWDTLAMMAAANEVWQNGDFSAAQMAEMLAPYRARGALVGHSDSSPAEEPEALAAISKGAPIYIVHGLRNGTPSLVMDHIFSLGYFEPRQDVPRLGWQREPTGPGAGVSVGRVEDREQLALMAATALLSRQAWNYMCGDCVFWNAPIERSPGFYAVPRIREVLQVFAPDVMAWPKLRHGGRSDAALNSPTGWFGDPGVKEGPGRINMAISADRRRVVGTVTGGSGRKQIRNALNCPLDLTVVSVHDDEVVQQHTFTLQPGQSLDLDYRIGRLLLGACQSPQ